MKKISLLIAAIIAFAGRSKLEVYEANILGTWVAASLCSKARVL